MEPCPICTEDMTIDDKLGCGHYAHVVCVKQAVDAMQNELVSQGYPARSYAQCPLCRADLIDIPAKPASWFGEITCQREQLEELIKLINIGKGTIMEESIPTFISDQMPSAHPKAQRSFTIKAATLLWLSYTHIGNRDLPEAMTIRHVKDSRRRGCFGHKIIF